MPTPGLKNLGELWTVCPHQNCGQANRYAILPTSCPRVVSRWDLTGPWEVRQKCVPDSPYKPHTVRLLSYPARIRTWKNRTKTCCDTVSPPGSAAGRHVILAVGSPAEKPSRRRKRRRPCS